MKLKAAGFSAATTCSSANWFSALFLAAFSTIIFALPAVPETGEEGVNPAEKWVVAQTAAGEMADLSKRFPEEKDRWLSAHFLEQLLMGSLPGFKLHRKGVRIIGALIDGPIDLENAQILCEVQLRRCRFSSANFRRASFAGVVLLDGSTFRAGVNFNSTKVEGGASFKDAVFEGPANFVGADIASYLEASRAKFQNKEQGAQFGGMKVGGYALFMDAVFEGPVNFTGANIASNFNAAAAKFLNKEKAVLFIAMKVGQVAVLDKAVFEGPVNFVRADFAGSFQAAAAKFLNKEKVADFNNMKVGGNASFKDAVFEGPVNFVRAEITGSFLAPQAKFQNKEKVANFNSMKVEGGAIFKDAVFEGPVNFDYASFALLDLSKVAGHFHMQEMSYKYIKAAPEEPESHKELLKLADQSAYTADVYNNLEAFFLRQGYRGDADRAFIAGKRRERRENLQGLGWLGSCLLDWLVGYGRRPWQAGIPCAVLVALGCVLFSPKKMEPQKPEDTPRVYSRFWYSLGLFLPVVDLQTDTVWKPKADQTFLRNYARVHALLGWILIPIVLAALTGLIK